MVEQLLITPEARGSHRINQFFANSYSVKKKIKRPGLAHLLKIKKFTDKLRLLRLKINPNTVVVNLFVNYSFIVD